MRLLLIILVVSCCEWIAYLYLKSDQLWYYLHCSKQLSIALGLQLAFSFAGKIELRAKTVLVFLCCTAWLDFPLKIVWALFDIESAGLAPLAAFLFSWSLFIIARKYEIKSDTVNHETVTLLMLKPKGFGGIVKSLIGFPVSSVCILSNGYVWSFRSGCKYFCKTKYSERWLESHVCVNTGVEVSESIINMLEDTVGASRGVGVKCVYVIRNVLEEIGDEYKPKYLFQYIPCFYAMKILGEKR